MDELAKDRPVKHWKPGDPVRVVEDLKEDAKLDNNGEPYPEKRISKPIVKEPTAPAVMDKDLTKLPKTEPYRPGDEVRVVPDLKESEPEESNEE
ncbi:MAG: hypothetical protein U9Q71_07920 [Pseudomonadota bacterium]|nr:hypothetical protein [Pseudomonadota bacterium]